MSLFHEVSESIAKQAVGDIRSSLQRKASARFSAAMSAVNSHVPPELQKYSSKLIGAAASRLGVGDLLGLNGTSRVNQSSSFEFSRRNLGGTPESFWTTENPLMGGITPREAKQIYEEAIGQDRAWKNLWLIEVSSNLNDGQQNIPTLFNMFATELSYSPFIVTGDAIKVGGANYDQVRGHEPSELTMTTYDDAEGSIKRWFAAHHHAATGRNGTVSEPGKYAIRIRIVHNAITEQKAEGRFESVGLFRPVNLEISLSRSESGLEELQMTFAQLDTFMRP